MRTRLIPASSFQPPDSYWRLLNYFNLFRLTVAGFFVVTFVQFGAVLTFGVDDPTLFFLVSILYTLFAALMVLPISLRWPRFNVLLSIQVGADVAFIVILMHASGGIGSGLSLLLLVSLAATGMVSRGRLAMFHAALASLAILGEQTYRVLGLGADERYYLHAGLMSMGFFATAGLAFALARRLTASELLAREQSIDLENLSQVNQLVIRDMHDGVLVVDDRGRVRQRNPQAEKLVGPPPAIRRDLFLNDYFPALAAQLSQWLDQPQTVPGPLRAPATGRRLQARFIGIGGIHSLGAVIFLQDLSAVQAQAQQMKLAALGRLTANIAHEIRNPLSAISHAAELLEEERDRDPTRLRLLQIIRDNTQRLDRMVQDVLRLNRRDRADPERLELGAYLAGFAEEFGRTERLPQGAVAVQAEPGLAVWFDRYHLHQVLWNLCRNGWRHGSQTAGSLRLVAGFQPIENAVQLDVIDDGPGVEEGLRSQLFEPFFTTDSTGTGLGLYIARELCEANGATLDYVEGAAGGSFRIGFAPVDSKRGRD